MIRNYNGNVNRSTLRDLKKLCGVHEENRKNLMDKFEKDGAVSFYTNLNPFYDGPDEMSDMVTLKSKSEIEEYLKADFQERLGNYLHYRNPASDYLLDLLIEYLKEHSGNYPSKDEMTELELKAESERKSATTVEAKPMRAYEMLLKEILELTEEVMEARRETNPDDIWKHVDPYEDELHITTCDDFEAVFMWDRHEGRGDSTDYRLKVWMTNNDPLVNKIYFSYRCEGEACVRAEGLSDELIETKDIMDRIITVHRGMVNIAKQEGLEVTSEVNYEELSA